ncbi:MAG TPA: flavin reductase family protein [Acetobacteraceae bacterium]|nr:flavin reductase family protein [Acetobacteraceae bacterium]
MLFDFDRLSPENCYKLLVSTVVPRPIAWVVTGDLAGRVNAAPFSFFNAVSGDPPIVVIGIGGRGPGESKDTSVNIRNTSEFVVNLVSAACAERMNVTAIEFESEVRELEEAGLTQVPSVKVKPPRIAESPVALECVKHVTVELGTDRSVVFGRVLAAHVRDDAVLDGSRQVLYRRAQAGPDRAHAWARLVRAYARAFRHAAHRSGGMGEQEGGRLERDAFASAHVPRSRHLFSRVIQACGEPTSARHAPDHCGVWRNRGTPE